MALVVEDGTGLANAEAYAAVADFVDYYTKRGETTLAAKTVAEIEVALRKGADALDNFYRGRWKGVQTTTTQALSWPREGVVDDHEALEHDDDYVPPQIAKASIILAGKSFSADLQPDAERSGTIKREMKQVGPLQKEIEYTEGQDISNIYNSVDTLVRGLITTGSRTLLRA